MNGAVARPENVLAIVLSLLSILPLLFVSYAAPPAYVSAYRFALKSAQGVEAVSVVVVENTMSPATDGEVDGRSPVARPPELVTLAKSTANFVVAPAPGELSFKAYSLKVSAPPGALDGSRSLPVAKNM